MVFGPLRCELCGKDYWVLHRRRLENSRFCSRLCRARGINTPEVRAKKAHFGAAHPRYLPIGTRRKWKSTPGIMVKTIDGWQREHRVIARAGRGEVVHHCDENPDNNDADNLVRMRQALHAGLHLPDRQRDGLGRFVAQQLNSSLVVAIA